MPQSIYVMFQLRMTEAWHRLSEKEQNHALDKITAITESGVEQDKE